MSLARQRLFSLVLAPDHIGLLACPCGLRKPSNPNSKPSEKQFRNLHGHPSLCPVNVVTKWTGAILNAPTLALDGVSVTNGLAINGTGTITAPPGPHTIAVNGTIAIDNGATNVSDTARLALLLHHPQSFCRQRAESRCKPEAAGRIKVTTSTPLASSLIVTLTSGDANVAKLGSPPAASHTATLQPSSTSMPSSAQDSVSGLSAGTTTIGASAPGIQSSPAAKINLTVSAVAPPPKVAVFRTSSTDVQSFAFSSTVDTQPATFSPGKLVVGLALSESGALLRTSVSDIQVFTINPDLALAPGSATGASLSGTAASVASKILVDDCSFRSIGSTTIFAIVFGVLCALFGIFTN